MHRVSDDRCADIRHAGFVWGSGTYVFSECCAYTENCVSTAFVAQLSVLKEVV